jgi:hypothetical protein
LDRRPGRTSFSQIYVPLLGIVCPRNREFIFSLKVHRPFRRAGPPGALSALGTGLSDPVLLRVLFIEPLGLDTDDCIPIQTQISHFCRPAIAPLRLSDQTLSNAISKCDRSDDRISFQRCLHFAFPLLLGQIRSRKEQSQGPLKVF